MAQLAPIWAPKTSKSDNKQKSNGILHKCEFPRAIREYFLGGGHRLFFIFVLNKTWFICRYLMEMGCDCSPQYWPTLVLGEHEYRHGFERTISGCVCQCFTAMLCYAETCHSAHSIFRKTRQLHNKDVSSIGAEEKIFKK